VITPEEKFEVKERLLGYRKRIINGESFEALARLYSEDPGSARQGGDIGLRGRGELYPEFEAVAFKLEPDEISDIVESEAGYHIIQGIERRGDFVRVRHILLKPVCPVTSTFLPLYVFKNPIFTKFSRLDFLSTFFPAIDYPDKYPCTAKNPYGDKQPILLVQQEHL
jgi:hypothetical protein